jgi:hypothetical protein
MRDSPNVIGFSSLAILARWCSRRVGPSLRGALARRSCNQPGYRALCFALRPSVVLGGGSPHDCGHFAYCTEVATLNVDKIPPGPDLDAVAAEQVFGWKNVHRWIQFRLVARCVFTAAPISFIVAPGSGTRTFQPLAQKGSATATVRK